MVLFPADHAISGVIQDQNHQVQVQPYRGFQLLRIHHEAAIAAHGKNPALGRKHRRHHRRRKARTHGGQGIIDEDRIRLVRDIVAGKPDLVDAIVERDDIVRCHDLSARLRQHAAAP